MRETYQGEGDPAQPGTGDGAMPGAVLTPSRPVPAERLPTHCSVCGRRILTNRTTGKCWVHRKVQEPEFVGELVIVGDEAWTLDEWQAARKAKEHQRDYKQQPQIRAARRPRERRAYDPAHKRAYRQKPEVREQRTAYHKAYMQMPENQEHRRAYITAYNQRPEVRERVTALNLSRRIARLEQRLAELRALSASRSEPGQPHVVEAQSGAPKAVDASRLDPGSAHDGGLAPAVRDARFGAPLAGSTLLDQRPAGSAP